MFDNLAALRAEIQTKIKEKWSKVGEDEQIRLLLLLFNVDRKASMHEIKAYELVKEMLDRCSKITDLLLPSSIRSIFNKLRDPERAVFNNLEGHKEVLFECITGIDNLLGAADLKAEDQFSELESKLLDSDKSSNPEK